MSRLFGASVALVLFTVACGGTPAATPTAVAPTPAGEFTPPASTAPPGGPTSQPPTGSFEAIARALVPAGATETQHVSVEGAFLLYVHTTMTLQQVEAHFDQAIPAQGMAIQGKFTMGPVLTIGMENPAGGVVATASDTGGTDIVITVGTSE